MTRGQAVEIGATRIAKNGYHYTKVEDEKGKPHWKLTHWIVAEQMLGRPLRPDDKVTFIGSKSDLSPSNIKIKKKALPPLDRRINTLKDRIADLQDELEGLQEEKKREQKAPKK